MMHLKLLEREFSIERKTVEIKAGESALDVEAAKILRMHGGGEQLEYLKVQDIVGKYFKLAEDVGKFV